MQVGELPEYAMTYSSAKYPALRVYGNWAAGKGKHSQGSTLGGALMLDVVPSALWHLCNFSGFSLSYKLEVIVRR